MCVNSILTTGIRAKEIQHDHSSKLGIEKFDGSDLSFWKMQIEDYLYQKDLHEPLTAVKPEFMMEEKWKLKDRQALGLIG